MRATYCDYPVLEHTLNITPQRRFVNSIGDYWGSVDSLHFNIPDMREAVPCGVGRRPAGVGNHDEFTLGQFKDDQIQAFLSEIRTSTPTFEGPKISINKTNRAESGNLDVLGSYYNGSGWADTNSWVNFSKYGGGRPLGQACSDAPGYNDWSVANWRYGKSTRTKQIGVNYIIKF